MACESVKKIAGICIPNLIKLLFFEKHENTFLIIFINHYICVERAWDYVSSVELQRVDSLGVTLKCEEQFWTARPVRIPYLELYMSHVIAPKILMVHSSCACDCSFWRNWKPRHKKGLFKQQEGIPVPINNICDLNLDWDRFFENLRFWLRSIFHNSGINIEILNLNPENPLFPDFRRF